jgi:hypothetical protein
LFPPNDKAPQLRGLVIGGKVDQKNEPISTEKMLIQAQTINPVTTTMGKP